MLRETQKALLKRARLNGAAREGKYVAVAGRLDRLRQAPLTRANRRLADRPQRHAHVVNAGVVDQRNGRSGKFVAIEFHPHDAA